MIEYADRHLRGHLQYYGVSGNFRSVRVYIHLCAKRLYRALIRRSQRRRLTWARFWERIAPRLPRARIVHNRFVPPAVWLTRTGSRMVQRTTSGSARGRHPYPCRAEILWHRRETRRQTENTNFGLQQGGGAGLLSQTICLRKATWSDL
jgi:hypothetical protein